MSDERQSVADELLLLTALKDRAQEEIDARRRTVEAWTVGSKVTSVLPDPEVANRPRKVGEVRQDGGQGVARVKDPAAWLAWCLEHAAHNVLDVPERLGRWASSPESSAALQHARAAADTAVSAGGFGSGSLWAEKFLRALEDAGYTLARITVEPGGQQVAPSWEAETLKVSQKAGKPVTPGGDTPAGIEVTTAPGKAYIKLEKDPVLRREFVTAHVGRLEAITGQVPDAQ